MNDLVVHDPRQRYPAVAEELASLLSPEHIEMAYAAANRRAMNLLIDRGLLRWRNPRFAFNGMIDVELDHPLWGWIPFSASPDDVELYGRRIFRSLLLQGVAEPYYGELPPHFIRELEHQHAQL